MATQPINPCKSKGCYGGHYRGRFIETSEGRAPLPDRCECSLPFPGIDKKHGPRCYALNRRSGEDIQQTFLIKDPRRPPPRSVVVVPCKKVFLNPDSPGTIAYLRVYGDKSKFRGCQAVEDYLTEEGLVCGTVTDVVGKSKDIRLGIMIDAKAFRSFSLSLIDENENERFEQRHEELIARMEKFLASLTLHQRRALQRVYMFNHEGLSKTEIARRLRIRPDTFQERIDRAFKKAEECFPEFTMPRRRRFNAAPCHVGQKNAAQDPEITHFDYELDEEPVVEVDIGLDPVPE